MGIEVWISVLAVVISLYSAHHARRSARAAEKAAAASDQNVAIERDRERETWVAQLYHALPDPRQVEGVLEDLPEWLRPEWKGLLNSAMRRNQRTPPAVAEALFDKPNQVWRAAATGQAEVEH